MASTPRRRIVATIFAVGIALGSSCGGQVFAQNKPGEDPADRGGLSGSWSREDLEKMGGIKDTSPDKDAVVPGAASRAKAKAQSEKLASAMQLACEVTDAQLVVSGSITVDNKEVPASVYEIACSDAMGYLLESQGGANKTIAISCLAADGARAADMAQGRESKFVCKLPKNRDVKAMAASLMSGAGTPCAVRELRWFGRSVATQSEYSEVVCDDGKGFLLRTAMPGPQAKTEVIGCGDAARKGIKCRMTDAGPIETPVTMQTFKDALAHQGVSCNIGQIRLVGQEDHLKRYVVEYLCSDQASGVVAFIPLAGNSNPYESLDCHAAAAQRGVACELTPAK